MSRFILVPTSVASARHPHTAPPLSPPWHASVLARTLADLVLPASAADWRERLALSALFDEAGAPGRRPDEPLHPAGGGAG